MVRLSLAGGDRRHDRSMTRFFFVLAAVLLLSVGVAAEPEERKPALEAAPQEVTVTSPLVGSTCRCFIVQADAAVCPRVFDAGCSASSAC